MRVLIIDDHPMVIAGCRGILSSQPDIEIIEARDAAEALECFHSMPPDVVVLDINLPELSGFELLRRIRTHEPAAPVLVFTMHEDPVFAARAIELGAAGYLTKNEDPSQFFKAVKIVAEGRCFLSNQLAQKLAFLQQKQQSNPLAELSAREIETLKWIAEGKEMAEIAHIMKISYKTVSNCCSLLKRKLGARSRADLIRIAIENRAAKKIV